MDTILTPIQLYVFQIVHLLRIPLFFLFFLPGIALVLVENDNRDYYDNCMKEKIIGTIFILLGILGGIIYCIVPNDDILVRQFAVEHIASHKDCTYSLEEAIEIAKKEKDEMR